MNFKTLSEYASLTKPKLISLSAATVALGYCEGALSHWHLPSLFHVVFGALLVGMSCSVLNQIMERDIDAKMRRTNNRPLASQRIPAQNAYWFAGALGGGGLLYLLLSVSALTAGLAFLTLLSYVAFYTPLKRMTVWNTFAGAVPGALPILIGWSAATPELGMEAWLLFSILFVWQIPHFYAIAWIHRQDYRMSGFKMISVLDESGEATSFQILFFTLVLFVISLMPTLIGMAGILYLGAAFCAGIILVALAIRIYQTRIQKAERFMRATIIYLLVLISAMIFDKIGP